MKISTLTIIILVWISWKIAQFFAFHQIQAATWGNPNDFSLAIDLLTTVYTIVITFIFIGVDFLLKKLYKSLKRKEYNAVLLHFFGLFALIGTSYGAITETYNQWYLNQISKGIVMASFAEKTVCIIPEKSKVLYLKDNMIIIAQWSESKQSYVFSEIPCKENKE